LGKLEIFFPKKHQNVRWSVQVLIDYASGGSPKVRFFDQRNEKSKRMGLLGHKFRVHVEWRRLDVIGSVIHSGPLGGLAQLQAQFQADIVQFGLLQV